MNGLGNNHKSARTMLVRAKHNYQSGHTWAANGSKLCQEMGLSMTVK